MVILSPHLVQLLTETPPTHHLHIHHLYSGLTPLFHHSIQYIFVLQTMPHFNPNWWRPQLAVQLHCNGFKYPLLPDLGGRSVAFLGRSLHWEYSTSTSTFQPLSRSLTFTVSRDVLRSQALSQVPSHSTTIQVPWTRLVREVCMESVWSMYRWQ